jgi:hypothetical protein
METNTVFMFLTSVTYLIPMWGAEEQMEKLTETAMLQKLFPHYLPIQHPHLPLGAAEYSVSGKYVSSF